MGTNKKKLYNKAVDNLFSTKSAIRSEQKDLFVGQSNHIVYILNKLLKGTSVALIGERGVGKTSLGWQILELVSGNDELIDQNRIDVPFLIPEYICIWIECSAVVPNVEGIIMKALTSSRKFEGPDSIIQELLRDSEQELILKSHLQRLTGVVDVDEISDYFEEESKDYAFGPVDRIVNRISKQKDSLFEIFEQVVASIKKSFNKDVLIFLDEFDRVSDKTGIGDLLKTVSNASFVVIGVADDLDEIIEDHPSVERKLINSVQKLDRFTQEESNELLDRIQQLSIPVGITIRFDDEFREQAFVYSDGFPYLIQNFAEIAFTEKWINEFHDITNHVNLGLESFYKALVNVVNPTSSDKRFRAIRNSYSNREGIKIILEELAFNNLTGEVDSEELKKNLGRAYRYSNNIQDLKKNKVIENVRGKIRFADPIYKALIRLSFDNEATEYITFENPFSSNS